MASWSWLVQVFFGEKENKPPLCGPISYESMYDRLVYIQTNVVAVAGDDGGAF